MTPVPAAAYSDTRFRQGKVVMVGNAWQLNYKALPQEPINDPGWLPKLEARVSHILDKEAELCIFNETSVRTEVSGTAGHLYKMKVGDTFLLGFQPEGKPGRIEITPTGGFLLLDERAHPFPLTTEQGQRVAESAEKTQALPNNFDRLVGMEYSKDNRQRGNFIKRLQSGYLLKHDQWLPTHKVAREWQTIPFPERLREPLTLLFEAEHAQPVPNGKQQAVQGLASDVSWTKWLDTKVVPRDGIIDLRATGMPHRIELSLDYGYILDSGAPQRFVLPPDIQKTVAGVFARCPNPYSKGKTSFEPATGETERNLLDEGIRYVVGMDESGRGNWAGPLTAAACYLDLQAIPESVRMFRDSKSYTETELQTAHQVLKELHLPVGLGIVGAEEINKLGNLDVANRLAFERALANLRKQHPALPIDCVLVDGSSVKIESDLKTKQVTQGERYSHAIAAASVMATSAQNEEMRRLGALYPKSGFELHRGAGSKTHEEQIKRHGLTPEHRTNFAPIRRLQAELNSRLPEARI